MAVQGVVSLASGKANNVSPVALHLVRKACRDMGTARPVPTRRNSNEDDQYGSQDNAVGRRLCRRHKRPCAAGRYPTDGGMDRSGPYHQRAPDSGGGEGGPAIRPQAAATGGSPAGPRPRASRIPAAQGEADRKLQGCFVRRTESAGRELVREIQDLP